MANSLLDFVMSLVRDPDAAARYAADPAQAIADAQLTDVSSADVQNLIPVVSESLSMAAPVHGLGRLRCRAGGQCLGQRSGYRRIRRVRRPSAPIRRHRRRVVLHDIVDQGDPAFEALTGTDLVDTASSLEFDVPLLEDAAAPDSGLADDWIQPVADPGDHIPGFDIFD